MKNTHGQLPLLVCSAIVLGRSKSTSKSLFFPMPRRDSQSSLAFVRLMMALTGSLSLDLRAWVG
jgi:hypothetical protein